MEAMPSRISSFVANFFSFFLSFCVGDPAERLGGVLRNRRRSARPAHPAVSGVSDSAFSSPAWLAGLDVAAGSACALASAAPSGGSLAALSAAVFASL
jgi:hypothetical protein